MTSAEKILRRKSFIKTEMDKVLEKPDSDVLWRKAADRLTEILEQYSTLPKGVRTHTDNFIFPAAAVYLTVKEAAGNETAYAIIENAAIANTETLGKKLAMLMRIPGMPGLFIR
ncbi:MAG: hypothetical protein IKP86_09735, partial [Anaerolineaceae bacterium]|nr:hypothetical protein [Anaerolineaceae bacterium]